MSVWAHLILGNKAVGLDGLLPLQEDHVIQRGEGERLRRYASRNCEKLSEQTFVREIEALIPQRASPVNITEMNVRVAQNNVPHETLRQPESGRHRTSDKDNLIYELHQLCNHNTDMRRKI